MEISERALKTYEILQHRRKEKERQHRQDIEAVAAKSYLRNYKIKYGAYYSLGHKK